jgi:hypothetical protein
MKAIVRNKTISFAVTQEMYDFIKSKSDTMGLTPSTFSYRWFLHSFEEEMLEKRK